MARSLAEEESRHIIDVLTTQNHQLRQSLEEVDQSSDPGAGTGTRTKSPVIEISSAGLSASQEQELRLLVAKFAESLGGDFDAKIFADGEECFHPQQEAGKVSSLVRSPSRSHPPEQNYRWFVEPDDAMLVRKMRVAAGMADNLFRTQCRCSCNRTQPTQPRQRSPASSLPSLMRHASLSDSQRRHHTAHHTCKPTSATTIAHLRNLGVYKAPRVPGLSPTSPLRDEARKAAAFPWISIRLLYNLAQVHLLDIRLGLFQQALRKFSRLLEVSRGGEEARLRGRRGRRWLKG